MNCSEIRLFVGNVPENTDKQELSSVFSQFGEIINLDLKSRSEGENKKCFAFVTLSATNHEVEFCIKHFSNEVFKGSKLYVTRARESFLERLQRERDIQKNEQNQIQNTKSPVTTTPVLNLDDNLNRRKRSVDGNTRKAEQKHNKAERELSASPPADGRKLLKVSSPENGPKRIKVSTPDKGCKLLRASPPADGCKLPRNRIQKIEDSDKKRIDSLKRKRKEYLQQQSIIKSGLGGVDKKIQNKKIVFSDGEAFPTKDNFLLRASPPKHKNKTLFEENDSGDEINFNIKKQFEGKKGQKVLDLQSRYKSDKRFVLDERFIDDEAEEEKEVLDNEQVDLEQVDEKTRQLNILQDLLGFAVKTSMNKDANNKKTKSKIGMFRFNPLQPEHAKFIAPVEEQQDQAKKLKKKKSKEKQDEEQPTEPKVEAPKVEVSKEQFYNVSETLKEAITKPASFSLRSLFGNNEEESQEKEETTAMEYIPLAMPNKDKKKIKNPMDLGQKNPFVYDSSDSEDEQVKKVNQKTVVPAAEPRAVWKENLFFSKTDQRFKDGLGFFNKINENEVQKERRELKSLMKKRIYNKERKTQMFQKKIGGRRKSMKKSYRKKS